MSTSHSINFKGFDFDFNYNFSKGCPATHDEPEEYDEFEIYNITLNGIDASWLLESQIEEFEQEVIDNLKSYDH
jgi:hypothetical protein